MICEEPFLCRMEGCERFQSELKNRTQIQSSGSLGMVIRPKYLDPTVSAFD